MLDYILMQAQNFHRSHGIEPNVVYLNDQHYFQLCEDLPDLFGKDPVIKLGFHIAILPSDTLTQPRVAWVPTRTPPLQRDVFADCVIQKTRSD